MELWTTTSVVGTASASRHSRRQRLNRITRDRHQVTWAHRRDLARSGAHRSSRPPLHSPTGALIPHPHPHAQCPFGGWTRGRLRAGCTQSACRGASTHHARHRRPSPDGGRGHGLGFYEDFSCAACTRRTSDNFTIEILSMFHGQCAACRGGQTDARKRVTTSHFNFSQLCAAPSQRKLRSIKSSRTERPTLDS